MKLSPLFVSFLFFLFSLVLFVGVASAIEVDPNEQPERVLNCTLPLTYTNGEPIPEGDITEIRLYETTQAGVYSQTPVATGQDCRFTITTTDKPDGSSYYYTATVISARYGTESDRSNEEVLDIVVKRRPNPPVVGWE